MSPGAISSTGKSGNPGGKKIREILSWNSTRHLEQIISLKTIFFCLITAIHMPYPNRKQIYSMFLKTINNNLVFFKTSCLCIMPFLKKPPTHVQVVNLWFTATNHLDVIMCRWMSDRVHATPCPRTPPLQSSQATSPSPARTGAELPPPPGPGKGYCVHIMYICTMITLFPVQWRKLLLLYLLIRAVT